MVMVYHFNVRAALFVVHGKPLFSTAALSVDLFFMLSGFVLAFSYGQKVKAGMRFSKYMSKRLIRLYPMYFIGLIIGLISAILLIGTPYANFGYSGISNGFFLNAFFMPYIHNYTIYSFGGVRGNWGEIFMLNPPGWSLFFEMFVSIIFVFLAKLEDRTLNYFCGISFTFLIAIGFATMKMKGDFGFTAEMGWGRENIWGGFPRVLFGFTLGMILLRENTIRNYIAHHLRNYFGIISLYFILIVSLSLPFNFHGIYSLIFLVFAAPVMISLGADLQEKSIILQKITDFLGRISYPLYCVHFPVGRIVYYYSVQFKINAWVTFGFAIFASTFMAWLLGEYLDVPLRRSIASWQSKAAAKAA